MTIKEWLDFAIKSQEQLKIENDYIQFPQWNAGYLEALKNMKVIVTTETNPTIEELHQRCDKMAFFLGLAFGGLSEFVKDETISEIQKAPLIDLLDRLSTYLDGLFYGKVADK
jgi:hypothetical protein